MKSKDMALMSEEYRATLDKAVVACQTQVRRRGAEVGNAAEEGGK